MDVYPGEAVDMVVAPGEQWPLADGSVDTVLVTEVIEHVADPVFLVGEIRRVLRKGGLVVATAPFLYPVHHPTDDYRRYTDTGLAAEFAEGFETGWTARTGGAFSVLGLSLLLLIETASNANRLSRLCKGLLMPVWLLVSLLINVLCFALDRPAGPRSFFLHAVYRGNRL